MGGDIERKCMCVGRRGERRRGRGEGKTLSGDSTFQLLSHSDERHFGLVTGTVVSPLQLLCFLKNRQKEVNNLGWFESCNATKGSKMTPLSVPTHTLSNSPAWTFSL